MLNISQPPCIDTDHREWPSIDGPPPLLYSPLEPVTGYQIIQQVNTTHSSIILHNTVWNRNGHLLLFCPVEPCTALHWFSAGYITADINRFVISTIVPIVLRASNNGTKVNKLSMKTTEPFTKFLFFTKSNTTLGLVHQESCSLLYGYLIHSRARTKHMIHV